LNFDSAVAHDSTDVSIYLDAIHRDLPAIGSDRTTWSGVKQLFV